MFGYYRLAAAVPQLRVAEVDYNIDRLIETYQEASAKETAAVVFPELCITGATCGDLFFQPALQKAALNGLMRFAEATLDCATVAVVGLPYRHDDALLNVAAVVQNGRILGMVAKSVLPNNRDNYEKRYFSTLPAGEFILLTDAEDEAVTLGANLLFKDDEFCLGVEIGADLWSLIPPSSALALAGAKVILNPAAGSEQAGIAAYRRDVVMLQSARCLCAYAQVNAGVHESTTDAVYSGHALIADNGRLAAENERFCRETSIIYADVDLERLGAARLSESSFNDQKTQNHANAVEVPLSLPVPESPSLAFAKLPSHPFIPAAADKTERCEEILAIQTAALVKRLEHTHAKKLVIGISGGLDSTLALLICARACKMMRRPNTDILAITMPGFGTTGRTRGNAVDMCALLGTDFREVPITEACLQHFRDIGHNPAERTTTYENVQARERTQILMDLANKLGGPVIGTGDLSEIALGWSTYNGDHMSMYSVNCSIPKTLIRCLIEHIAAQSSPELARILTDINNTPVSPELLPPAEDGKIEQKTEDLLGPYDLHDFFLYHFIKYGAEPDKIQYLAEHAFKGQFEPDFIAKCLRTFIRRFFQQQFKRNCSTDGPKVGSIALSPRGDWRMPSDAWATVWE